MPARSRMESWFSLLTWCSARRLTAVTRAAFAEALGRVMGQRG